ncbi:unnamed protein product [Caenorhabditis sp. 36 PRJEB53466]|nr:unnamed protein product [Caenorhabditis sp. 36 PRJEB53466]
MSENSKVVVSSSFSDRFFDFLDYLGLSQPADSEESEGISKTAPESVEPTQRTSEVAPEEMKAWAEKEKRERPTTTSTEQIHPEEEIGNTEPPVEEPKATWMDRIQATMWRGFSRNAPGEPEQLSAEEKSKIAPESAEAKKTQKTSSAESLIGSIPPSVWTKDTPL